MTNIYTFSKGLKQKMKEKYFEGVERLKYKEIIKDTDNIYAHVDTEENRKELLEEHMDLCVRYLNKISDEKNLYNAFTNFEKIILHDCSKEAKLLYKEMLYNCVYGHDLGKSNPKFQLVKMNNNFFEKNIGRNQDSNHSFSSSVIYFDYYGRKLGKLHKTINSDEFNMLYAILIINSYAISKHHGYLEDISNFINKFKDKLEYMSKGKEKEEFFNCINDKFGISKKLLENNSFYSCFKGNKDCLDLTAALIIYSRFVFSMIVTCDFYATSDFKNQRAVKDFGTINDIDKYIKTFEKTEVNKQIKKYKEGKRNLIYEKNDINQLRTEIYIESEKNLLENCDNHIFFFESPTGSGKTNSAINLSMKLLKKHKELNKIFYVFPFNTLVEQTKDSLFKAFNNDTKIINDIAVLNSVTSIKTYDKSEFESQNSKDKSIIPINEKNIVDYEKSLLARQFIHYPINITTHIKFFNILFGTDRESVFPLMHMANSVVVMDEIQSYKNIIWKEIIFFLKAYAKIMNIKIIIMSATLPDLSMLSYDKEKFCRLIDDREKYYLNKLFKDRVKLDFSLLKYDVNEIQEELTDRIISEHKRLKNHPTLHNKILVEFIFRNTAVKFYDDFCNIVKEQNLDAEVLLITGDDSRFEKKRIINILNENKKNVILIATQVIEAGADIDMDIGFKDVSIIDSEEQFLGRINRSCIKEEGLAYFFNLDDAGYIYRDDVRNLYELTLKDESMMKILGTKAFDKYYEKVIEFLEQIKEKNNERGMEYFIKSILQKFKFEEVEKHMKLIEDKKKYTLFINTIIKLQDGRVIEGKEVWDRYCKTLMDKKMSFARRKVELSQIAEDMDYFTYEIDELLFTHNDRIGDLIYIEDGSKYVINGKFNRNNLSNTNVVEFIF